MLLSNAAARDSTAHNNHDIVVRVSAPPTATPDLVVTRYPAAPRPVTAYVHARETHEAIGVELSLQLVRQGLQLVFIASTSADLKNTRALRVGLWATLFGPTDSARTDRTQSETSFPALKNTMQQEATQEQQEPADGEAPNAAPAAVGTRPPQPRPPTETPAPTP